MNARGAGIYDHPNFADSLIQWTEGRFGGAVYFDNTYFLATEDFWGIGGANPRTISLWVKTATIPGGGNVMVAWGPNVAQQRWHFKLENSADALGALRTENQGGNNFASIPVNDDTWHHIVSVFPEGGTVIGDVRHYVDGELDDVQSGTTGNVVDTNIDPATGRTVSIGGSPFDAGFRYIEGILDDVRVYSRALSPEEIRALANGEGVIAGAPPLVNLPDGVSGNPFQNPSDSLVFTAEPFGAATLNASGIRLEVNGTDVTSQATISGSPTSLAVSYSGFEPDSDQTVVLAVTDSSGLTARRSLRFSTYRADNLMIEAENYNFSGGQFFETPDLCEAIGGAPNCYFDRESLPGIDAFDSLGNTDDTTTLEDVYRYSASSPDRVEEFDTLVSSDTPRARYAAVGAREFDVDRLNAGDWANYTHTFPVDGTFRILLRARASAAQTVELSRVTSSPTAADQETTVLGYFQVPAGSEYGFAPLKDLTGTKELAISLSDLLTLRLTAVEAANNLFLNYLMFVPAERAVIAPTVAIEAPAEGSVHPTAGDVMIRALAEDADGFIASVTFFADSGSGPVEIGRDTTAPFEVTWPAVPAGSYSLSATAEDNDGLSASSVAVAIVVDSDPPTLNAVRGSSDGRSIELILSEAVEAATAQQTANYTLEPALTVLGAEAEGQRILLTTSGQTTGVEYTVTVRNLRDVHGNAASEQQGFFQAGATGLFFGLEGYWTFDDGAGGLARDLSGYGRDAAVYAVPAYEGRPILWTRGQYGGAIDFDGSYFLGVPGYYGIGGANPRTLSMWIKTDWAVSTGSNALLGWGRNATSARWHFKLESTGGGGALRTENQGGNNYGGIPVNDGAWHHVVAVFPDGGSVVGDTDHYVDAVLDEAKNGTTGTVVDTSIDPLLAAIVTLGGAPLGVGGELRPMIAQLDDVRVYRRALSLSEIEALSRGEGVLEGGLGPQPEMTITRQADGSVTLAWSGSGRLEQTGALGGVWSEVAGATSPYLVVPSATGASFYRIVEP